MDIVRGQTQGVSRSLVSPFWVSVPVIAYTICALAILQPAQAAVFNVPSGDVPALINAMSTANSNGEDNTINLEVGTYILTAMYDFFDGGNGLPTVNSNIIINGAGAESTVIARTAGTSKFRIFHVVDGGVLKLNGLTITGGATGDAGPFGGGILNRSTVILTNSTVRGNTGGSGGGIANLPEPAPAADTHMRITNSTISGNTSEEGFDGGGGILNLDADLTIINSTIAGNKADNTLFGGGGILNKGGTVTITNSTIARNRAVTSEKPGIGGGGILNEGTGEVTIKNTIVAQNVGAGGVGSPNSSDCGGNISNAGHNMSNGISCGFGEGDGVDPLLDTLGPLGLQDNGGPTQTIALLPGSPAINAIPPPDCTDLDVPPNPVTTDQRGFRRPFGAACDIGAFEFGMARVNDLVSQGTVSTSSLPPPPFPPTLFFITVTFTNTSSRFILNPFFQVIDLSGGNLLLNADTGPGGVGATLTPSVGADGILSPGELVTVMFETLLATPQPFTFLVNLLGVPSP